MSQTHIAVVVLNIFGFIYNIIVISMVISWCKFTIQLDRAFVISIVLADLFYNLKDGVLVLVWLNKLSLGMYNLETFKLTLIAVNVLRNTSICSGQWIQAIHVLNMFLKIRYPLKGNFFKAKNLIIVFLIWIVSGFLALTVALLFGLNKNKKINNIFLLSVQIIIVLPGPISLFLFFWIAVTSCKINLDVPPMPGGATAPTWKQQFKKFRKSLLKTAAMNFITSLCIPLHVIFVSLVYCCGLHVYGAKHFLTATVFITLVSSFINPWIFALRPSVSFREIKEKYLCFSESSSETGDTHLNTHINNNQISHL